MHECKREVGKARVEQAKALLAVSQSDLDFLYTVHWMYTFISKELENK